MANSLKQLAGSGSSAAPCGICHSASATQRDAPSGHPPQHGPESSFQQISETVLTVSESHSSETPSEKKDELSSSAGLTVNQSEQSEKASTEANKNSKTSDFGSVPNDSCFPVKKQLNAKQQMHHN